MINKQRNKNRELGSKNQPLFILFIDNLSKGVDQGWLRKTFNNYGVVKDAFIPSCKRSKRTGSKFGFVRYDCHVSAGVTISTSNGLKWVAYRNVVAKLYKLISINDLKVQMAGMGLDNIDIKAIGGRSVILTCSSREMEKLIEEKCFQRWFYESKSWNGQAACTERFVWLCCYGMPLNGWSNNFFKSIGESWGSFISTDESTMKMSSFAEAKILIATNIFKEIDEWIIVEVGEKSYCGGLGYKLGNRAI
ncbi:hypothetical protein RHMOL_Rhmol08G0251200 [Rhododendron molle]|uniref:Uncharacterized protein n=1 Tax=Rhododendron molle TaxID=49168 RepID=A0ACC0MS52_RHOML|nr:hypothetical protein RHMOL_Rhmol08G0251200 [Rhododendron molle]